MFQFGERRQKSNVIRSLKMRDEEEINEPNALRNHIQEYYKKLYSYEASLPNESIACVIPVDCEANNNSMQEILYEKVLHAI